MILPVRMERDFAKYKQETKRKDRFREMTVEEIDFLTDCMKWISTTAYKLKFKTLTLTDDIVFGGLCYSISGIYATDKKTKLSYYVSIMEGKEEHIYGLSDAGIKFGSEFTTFCTQFKKWLTDDLDLVGYLYAKGTRYIQWFKSKECPGIDYAMTHEGAWAMDKGFVKLYHAWKELNESVPMLGDMAFYYANFNKNYDKYSQIMSNYKLVKHYADKTLSKSRPNVAKALLEVLAKMEPYMGHYYCVLALEHILTNEKDMGIVRYQTAILKHYLNILMSIEGAGYSLSDIKEWVAYPEYHMQTENGERLATIGECTTRASGLKRTMRVYDYPHVQQDVNTLYWMYTGDKGCYKELVGKENACPPSDTVSLVNSIGNTVKSAVLNLDSAVFRDSIKDIKLFYDTRQTPLETAQDEKLGITRAALVAWAKGLKGGRNELLLSAHAIATGIITKAQLEHLTDKQIGLLRKAYTSYMLDKRESHERNKNQETLMHADTVVNNATLLRDSKYEFPITVCTTVITQRRVSPKQAVYVEKAYKELCRILSKQTGTENIEQMYGTDAVNELVTPIPQSEQVSVFDILEGVN